MNGVKEIRGEDFDREVLKSDIPVLVDFFAPWCGPCRALAPALEDMAGSYAGRVRFAKLNVDEALDLAARYGIRGVPTLMVFKNGRVVDTMVGLMPLRTLREHLNAVAGKAEAVPA